MSPFARMLASLGRFQREARARRVPQAALAYAALAWLTLQVGDILFPLLGLPETSMRVLIVLLSLGFPTTLALAWYFDLTPGGLRRDLADAHGPDTDSPHVAALLLLQPVDEASPLPAPLRHRLRGFNCLRVELEPNGLAAEFRSARDALDAALSALADYGATLRAGLAVGEVVRAFGQFSGATLQDVDAIARLAPPGGLAATSALHYSAITRLMPELAGRMRPSTRQRRAGEPHAWTAGPEDIATLPSPAAHGDPGEAGTPSTVRRGLLLAITLAILLAILATLWLDGAPGPGPPADTSIAVLPFGTHDSLPEDAWFAEGLADELFDALSRVEGLRLASRHSSYALRGEALDARQIGQRLDVATVLSASVRRDGRQLRIAAQLADTRSGYTLWSASYDRELIDVFTVQRDIARQVVRALLGVLPGEAGPMAERLAVTDDPGAYEAYLRGRQLLARRSSDGTLGEAIEWFGKALAIDPRMAHALAGVCIAETRRAERSRDAAARERADEACRRAMTAGPESGEVSLAQGHLLRLNGDLEAAAERFSHALGELPLRAEAFIGLAQTESAAGHDALAREYFLRARDADTGNWRTHHAFGVFLQERGEAAEAIEAFRTAIRLAPDDAVSPWNNLGTAYLLAGDYERAADAFQHAVAIEPIHSALSNLGTIRYYQRDYTAAAEHFRRAAALTPADYRTWGNLGDALRAGTGHGQESFAAYRRAEELATAWFRTRPEDAEVMAAVAWYRANLGQAEQALALSLRAMTMAPDNPRVARRAALVHARLGDTDAARVHLGRALSLGIGRRALEAEPLLEPLLPET